MNYDGFDIFLKYIRKGRKRVKIPPSTGFANHSINMQKVYYDIDFTTEGSIVKERKRKGINKEKKHFNRRSRINSNDTID